MQTSLPISGLSPPGQPPNICKCADRMHVSKLATPVQVPTKLNLGCGLDIKRDHVNLDRAATPGVDVVADLERCDTQPLPFADDSFDEIYASHLIEHIANTLPMMQELHRIAKPSCKAVFRLPYGSSDDAFEDPTHVRQYFLKSFFYFGQPFFWRADYGYRGDWQVRTIKLFVDGQRFADASPERVLWEIGNLRNVVSEMVVTLEAIKPIRPPLQELQEGPAIDIEYV